MRSLLRLALIATVCPFWGAAVSDSGCKLWGLHKGTDNVCCEKCAEGNRLVKECGPDPKTLCVPCESGTYTPVPGQPCQKCKTCTGLLFEKKPCTSSSNAECACLPGFHCDDAECTRCIQECGPGKELGSNGLCRSCPYGMFRNDEHQKCVPWSTRCPNAKYVIVRNGTKISDIQCNPVFGDDSVEDNLVMVAMAIGCFCLGLLPTVFLMWTWSKARKKEEEEERAATTEVEKHSEDSDSDSNSSSPLCRVGQPEQEQGGSVSSIHSQDMDKPLVSV